MQQTVVHKDHKHFKTFFEYATMGILITDRNGVINAVNPFALREFGYTEKELTGRKVEILVPTRYQSSHSQYHRVFIEKPATREMGKGRALFARRKDGSEMPVEISLSNYTLDGEKYVIAFINNITLRRQAEQKIAEFYLELERTVAQRTAQLNRTLKQLKKSQVELEKTASYQKAILENAGAMIIATDKKGIIKLFNPEAASELGYTADEVVGKLTPMAFHLKEEIAYKRRLLLQQHGVALQNDFDVMVENARRNIHEEQRFTYKCRGGKLLPVSLTITAIRDKKGKIIGYMGISIDISERVKAEKKLMKSLEKERELGDLKSKFISMASHEFRTPLSTILSSAFLIGKYSKAKDQHNRVKHLQRIESSVNTLSDILNDFLSIGKIEEGKLDAKYSEFDLRAMVTAALNEIEVTLKQGQKIRYRHTGPRLIKLDASLLKHIIMNLVSNASKFSAEDTLIELTTNNNDDFELSVKDEGIGIYEADQKHLMERFYRGANAATIQGTGLGLHIVAKYAELMHGSVHFTSEPGKGSVFTVRFKKIKNVS